MQIIDVQAFVPEKSAATDRKRWLQRPVASPMNIYPKYEGRRDRWVGPINFVPIVVQIETDEGITGLGVGSGGDVAALIVERHLRDLLLGEDPTDVELLWDYMYRATLPYGRKGLAIHAISGVDNALWDLVGKIRGEPVYRLLGGRTKDRIPVYATGRRPELYAPLGFHGNKMSMLHGPADGEAGMRENEAFVRRAREAFGDDRDIMVDAWMTWDVEYTLRMAERLARYGVRWIEEPLPPDDLEGMAFLRSQIKPMLLATGEHEYTRWGFRDLIAHGAADVLQPDVTWCGGITEMRKICALAAAHNLPVIPHIGGCFSYHLVMAHTNCPMAEYQVQGPEADQFVPIYAMFEREPLPVDGYVHLTDAPGFGLELRPDAPLRRPCIQFAPFPPR
jgi:L-rhamnonate dehydratase